MSREPTEVLFTNVRILDGSGQNAYSGSVRVRGQHILQITRSAGGVSSGDAMVIDGAGATLMPGMTPRHWLPFKPCRSRSLCCGLQRLRTAT